MALPAGAAIKSFAGAYRSGRTAGRLACLRPRWLVRRIGNRTSEGLKRRCAQVFVLGAVLLEDLLHGRTLRRERESSAGNLLTKLPVRRLLGAWWIGIMRSELVQLLRNGAAATTVIIPTAASGVNESGMRESTVSR
jgi:hypothetical protein